MTNGKKYTITLAGIDFEVTMEEYKEHHRIRNRKKYLRKYEKEAKVLSYDELKENGGEDKRIFINEESVEDIVIRQMQLQELRKVVKTLNDDELDLIKRIIYQEQKKREVADEYGVSCSTITYRWEKLLNKLRNIIS